MPNSVFEYPAFFFRQRTGSPLQVSFVANSAEIDAWARVPTKRTGNVRNFQRAEISQHVREVEQFFLDDANSSPTAIVVGFDPVRSKGGRVRLRGSVGNELVDHDVVPGVPVLGTIIVEAPSVADPMTSAEYRQGLLAVREQLADYIEAELREIVRLKAPIFTALSAEFEERTRLGEPRLSDALDMTDAAGESEEDEGDDAQASEDVEASVESLSPAAQKHLKAFSPSERQLIIGRLEFLANVQPTLLTAASESTLETLYRSVVSELKPAILIDGQHRVAGTKSIDNIPFLVCALPNAAWPELAFQFIVTNRTARRVQESLLINIVGNSLSKDQRAQIEERLRRAGIRVGLIEAIMKVDEDELSPFHGLIAFGIPNEQGFLDAAAMRNKVVKIWYERQQPIRQLFDHLCQGKLLRERTDYWKSEEIWFSLFCAFWDAVRERYVGSDVFSNELDGEGRPVSRLMSATVLKIFQETVLGAIFALARKKRDMEGVPFLETVKDVEGFGKLIQNTLKNLTPEFFQGWQITGFDGSRGAKEDLAEAIRLVIDGEASVPKLKKMPHRLFKEPSKKSANV